MAGLFVLNVCISFKLKIICGDPGKNVGLKNLNNRFISNS